MPAKSFVRRTLGTFKEVLGIVVSAGAANAGDIPALDDGGKLDVSLMPSGFGQDVTQAVATETITAPALVNLYLANGVQSVRNADNSTEGKEANGFVLASIASGASGTVNLSGTLSGLTGLTIDARYYLGTVGGVTVTPVTGVGKVDQLIGKATSASTIAFRAHDYVVKAS